jgi:hypothetical protein
VWSDYLASTRSETERVVRRLWPREEASEGSAPVVRLVDFDPDGEDKVLAAMCYPHTALGEEEILRRVRQMAAADRLGIVRAYVGDRTNRRHRPGRAFERTDYRFDVVADYGAFRDLQRHRMLSVEWQELSPRLGYDVPEIVVEAGRSKEFVFSLERSAELYTAMSEVCPSQAAYAVALAFRTRFVMQMNAREAMHVIELRSGPQGHPSYRRIVQEMYRLIAQQAGHRLIADAMSFADLGEHELERLDAARRAEARRASLAT